MAGLGEGYGADPTVLRIATSTAGEPRAASAHFNVSRAAAAGLDAAARVVAVPLASLDDRAWEPGFPEPWQTGLTGLATGTAAKLSVPTTNRARPYGVQHSPATCWRSSTVLTPGSVSSPSCGRTSS
jgi:monoamine oxidase